MAIYLKFVFISELLILTGVIITITLMDFVFVHNCAFPMALKARLGLHQCFLGFGNFSNKHMFHLSG